MEQAIAATGTNNKSLNIALIVPYFYIELYYYFSFYGNVYVQTYEPFYHGPYLGRRLRLLSHEYLHGFAGWLGMKLRSRRVAGLLARLLNPPHRFQSLHVVHDLGLARPESIDLVVVAELLCRYDLRRFRNAVKAFWAIDSFNEQRIFMYENVAGIDSYDLVFAAHRLGVERFREHGVEARFLPLALRYEWIYRPMSGVGKSYDVVFVGRLQRGTHSRRMRILGEIVERLRRHGVRVHYTAAWHHDASRLYNSSRIVLNVSRLSELNLRVFEALGTRSFLLSDDGEVRLVLEPGRHLEVFSSVEEAVDKILYYLGDSEARERIASEGHREVLEKHTMFHRVEKIIEEAGFRVETRWSRLMPRLLQGGAAAAESP